MRVPFLVPALLLAVAACTAAPPPPAPVFAVVDDPLAYADPRVGSGGFAFAAGSAFPGAAAPSGLVKVGPDTWSELYGNSIFSVFLHYSGYWAGDDFVQGFSHLHLSGTGATDYGVLSVMPLPAFLPTKRTVEANRSHFEKASEVATPGYYALTLDEGNIRVELAATPHAASHKYTFDASKPGRFVLFDLAHHLNGGEVTAAEATLYPAERRLTGKLHSKGGMSGGFGGYDVYFLVKTKQAWKSQQAWKNGEDPAPAEAVAGTDAGFVLELVDDGTPVEMQVSVSLVSLDGARQNLELEQPTLDFAAAKADTEEAWLKRLRAVRAYGGTETQRKMLYSTLHHAYVMPSVTCDVDGNYIYAGGRHQAPDYLFVSDLSLWDTYRTLNPLYALLAPDRARDVVKSLQAMDKFGGSFPRWAIATGDSGVMIGASADVVIADAYVKGVHDFDAESAWKRLRGAALDETPPEGGRGGRDSGSGPYMSLSYVPYTANDRSVSLTTEYAQDDFALSQLGAALGHAEDAQKLLDRSKGYRKLFDPATGFLRAKDETGHLKDGTFSEESWDDYAEANARQSVWAAPHDAEGLATLFGGREAMVAKLSEFFEKAKADDADRRIYHEDHPDDLLTVNRERPYFWAGNEPDIHAVYLFAQVGRPDLTQDWLPWIRDAFYAPTPEGLPGNDDGGTMGAWWLFSAFGFYPVPGSDLYVVGAPVFPKLELQVNGGTFTVDAPAVSDVNHFVQSVTLNGRPLAKPEFHHADLVPGGKLAFVMGPAPSAWGR